ncbi:MAG: NAD(P)-dependent oxidoreductase, partial [Clostridiales bacterium]|nr:NAD(P)-dependent oxidoreductase [Clostridiales bacterium]
MKTILVTGGNGALGKSFIELYKNKYDITAPAETDFTVYDEVATLFTDNKFDAVLHLPERGDEAHAYNLVAFKNIQHACIINGVKKLIIAGDASDLDCDRPLENVGEDELGKRVPTSAYAMGEYLSHVLAEKDKISTVLRFFTLYGKYARVENNRTADILSHAVTGKKEIVLDADKQISVIYTEDACKIITLFLENDYEQGIYNVAAPTPVSLYDFAKKAKNFAKKDAREV